MLSASELTNELNDLKKKYCEIAENNCKDCHFALEIKNAETGAYMHTCSIEFFKGIVESH